jgi:hypothetical protein
MVLHGIFPKLLGISVKLKGISVKNSFYPSNHIILSVKPHYLSVKRISPPIKPEKQDKTKEHQTLMLLQKFL